MQIQRSERRVLDRCLELPTLAVITKRIIGTVTAYRHAWCKILTPLTRLRLKRRCIDSLAVRYRVQQEVIRLVSVCRRRSTTTAITKECFCLGSVQYLSDS